MAVKWAVANGNWNAGATWNDGVVPTIDDDVYANNHIVTINVATLTVGSINTIANAEYGIAQGGSFTCSIATNISAARTCDLRFCTSNSSINYTPNTNANCYFNAPLIKSSSVQLVSHAWGDNTGWIITANIEISNQNEVLCGGGSTYTRHILTINGNITSSSGFFYSSFSSNSTAGWTVTINGNVYGGHEGSLNQGLSYVAINGNKHYCMNEQDRFLQGGMTISGSVTYESNDGSIGLDSRSTTILNPNAFTWKDVTQPQRVNPFIIVTYADMNNRQQYPQENEVKEGTEYVWGEKIGTYLPDYPPESVVLKDYEYGDSDDRKTGTMEQEVNVEVGCVTKEDVREGVELIGMGEVGTLVVPDVDDVREGVVFDNGSVGTLIVEGGGERLRIADFGYYTNAQSDTYIVDLTEQDKPKFAVAEERVLIEMFPDLDFDNIPDKYFDDLFVKYLKYRLIVEYYRTAGINSTFTPSEPTTEIVNYRNVNCEIWMNIANTYLKAWGEKYPNSIKKQRILL